MQHLCVESSDVNKMIASMESLHYSSFFFPSFQPGIQPSIHSFIHSFSRLSQVIVVQYALQDVQCSVFISTKLNAFFMLNCGELDSTMAKAEWIREKENDEPFSESSMLLEQKEEEYTKWYNSWFWCIFISKWYFASSLNWWELPKKE